MNTSLVNSIRRKQCKSLEVTKINDVKLKDEIYDEDAETEAYCSDESVANFSNHQRSLTKKEWIELNNKNTEVIEIEDYSEMESKNTSSDVALVKKETKGKSLECPQRSNLDRRIYALEETLSQLQNQILGSLDYNHSHSGNYLQQEMDRLRIQNENLLFKIGAMSRQLVDQECILSDLKNENQKLKGCLEILKEEKRVVDEENQNLREDKLKLQKEVNRSTQNAANETEYDIKHRPGSLSSKGEPHPEPRSTRRNIRTGSYICHVTKSHPYVPKHYQVNPRRSFLRDSAYVDY